MKLFRYISGNNEKNPAMTTPVYMKEDINGSMMEFVLPSTLNENNTSQPLSKDIELYGSRRCLCFNNLQWCE